MGIADDVDALKTRRRSVNPAEMHALLTEAGFARSYGKGDHWVYRHPLRARPLVIDPRKPLLPAYVVPGHPRDRGGARRCRRLNI